MPLFLSPGRRSDCVLFWQSEVLHPVPLPALALAINKDREQNIRGGGDTGEESGEKRGRGEEGGGGRVGAAG